MDKGFFQISADFDLKTKPDWLAGFRLKYDLPYDYHITLKTTTDFKMSDLENLKNDLQKIAGQQKTLTVAFDELFIAPAKSGWCIMIKSKKNQELFALQKEISEIFSKYGQHTNSEREEHEKSFQPHITIARHLTSEQLELAKNEIKNDLHCEAVINSLTLTIAEKDVFEEWSQPNNRIVYKFN